MPYRERPSRNVKVFGAVNMLIGQHWKDMSVGSMMMKGCRSSSRLGSSFKLLRRRTTLEKRRCTYHHAIVQNCINQENRLASIMLVLNAFVDSWRPEVQSLVVVTESYESLQAGRITDKHTSMAAAVWTQKWAIKSRNYTYSFRYLVMLKLTFRNWWRLIQWSCRDRQVRNRLSYTTVRAAFWCLVELGRSCEDVVSSVNWFDAAPNAYLQNF